jgi:pSer/pThr/pTyr-binding forkhead associated (FHA) protein
LIEGRVLPLTRVHTRIGRSSPTFTPEVDLSPFDSCELVSRRQAELLFDEHGISLVDLGSLNGTRLNGQDLLPGRASPLRDGDLIEFVGIAARFQRFAAWPEAREVEWPAPGEARPDETLLGRRWDARPA